MLRYQRDGLLPIQKLCRSPPVASRARDDGNASAAPRWHGLPVVAHGRMSVLPRREIACLPCRRRRLRRSPPHLWLGGNGGGRGVRHGSPAVVEPELGPCDSSPLAGQPIRFLLRSFGPALPFREGTMAGWSVSISIHRTKRSGVNRKVRIVW